MDSSTFIGSGTRILSWILLGATVLGISAGQVLFKIGANRLASRHGGGLLPWLNFPILLALALYAICTVLWVTVLRNFPLRIAYPFVALSYVIVPLLGRTLLGELLSARTLIGAVLIIVAVFISVGPD